ncbi:MAG: glycerophosphoryl diester phosphodiesterase [Legionella sp. 40-6]|nr:glycerophosphodiester phosphodiesterase [Legionella sp.]OJY44198.1 MAG: glycerophosphoryl diester phosphodiesterase [Legionella sp. 40-6]
MVVDKIIGHRGACAYAPENTMASFNKALEMGCRFIEFDVMCSEDGEPFVFHDDQLKRTTRVRGEFGKVNAAFIEKLDAGSWFSKHFKGEGIPHFRDILDWLQVHQVQANIEIKPYPGTDLETAIAVLNHLNRYWKPENPLPLISSFSYKALEMCRSISPEMPIGLLLHEWDEQWLDKAHALSCYSLHFNRKILTKTRVEAVKKAGYVICTYTVNRKRQANKLFSWGVDAVFSDFPDLLA